MDTGKQAGPLFSDGQWVWEKSYPQGVHWRIPLLKKPLFHILDQSAAKFGDHELCDFEGKSYTYAEIADMANRVARGLQLQGVGKGIKVGLFMPNTPYAIACYFGILKAGGTVVNYNPLYVDRELAFQIDDSETDIMITVDARMLTDKLSTLLETTRLKKVVVCKIADTLPLIKRVLYPVFKYKDISKATDDPRYMMFDALIDNDGRPEHVQIDAVQDIAVLQYTGGTTGVPKGAALSHGNIYANVQQTIAWMGRVIEPGRDVMVGVLPLFHVFAMTVVMHCAMWAGMKILLHPKFTAKDLLKSIRHGKPTLFPAVPAIFNALACLPNVRKSDFESLKFCMSGGAPLPGDVRRLFEEKTGCGRIGEGYGLTETSPVATFNPPAGKVKQGSVGQPLPGTIVEIISTEDGYTPMQIGEKGEVCITGPQVMMGYFNKPEATADVIKNGRLHTGDVGYVDEEGYLFLVDRIKDLILVRGYNVYPRHVEEAIYTHPDVEECIVAGVPDAERGETVRAWVKPVSGRKLTEDVLKDFLQDKVSPIEMPRKIVIRDQPLPKTAVGKLSKKDLLTQEGIHR